MEKITEFVYMLKMTRKEVMTLLIILTNFIENYENDEDSTEELDFCKEVGELFDFKEEEYF